MHRQTSQPFAGSSDANKCRSKQRRRPAVLVHMHYHETIALPFCELVMKRTNLLTFLVSATQQQSNIGSNAQGSVQYRITVSGDPLPSLSVFGQSIGIHASRLRSLLSDSPLLSAFAQFVQGGNGEYTSCAHRVSFSRVSNETTDLCHHAHAMSTQRDADYFVLLNDGARGPFVDQAAAALGAKLGVAPWLGRVLEPFVQSPRVVMVGAQLSCELGVHLQSWMIAIHARVAEETRHRYLQTCGTSKLEAIWRGEVLPSKQVMQEGHAIASLWPPFSQVTRQQFDCTRETPGSSVCRNELKGCRNPFVGKQGFAYKAPLVNVTFTKFGGEIWREKLIPAAHLELVLKATQHILNIDSDTHDDLQRKCAYHRLTTSSEALQPHRSHSIRTTISKAPQPHSWSNSIRSITSNAPYVLPFPILAICFAWFIHRKSCCGKATLG